MIVPGGSVYIDHEGRLWSRPSKLRMFLGWSMSKKDMPEGTCIHVHYKSMERKRG